MFHFRHSSFLLWRYRAGWFDSCGNRESTKIPTKGGKASLLANRSGKVVSCRGCYCTDMNQFYMVSLTIIGCLVPYTDPRLLNSGGPTGADASPFVIAVHNAQISAVPSIMNAVILIAVLSVGNSSIYGSSRTIAALADRGQAPKIFGYIDNAGRPLVAIIFAALIGLICFISAAGADTREQAFNWMLAISGLSSVITWMSICACHIRFRAAWKYHGHTLDELAFKSQPGVIGSYIGVIMNILILIAQFWVGFAPVGYASQSASARVQDFFEAYLSVPIIATFYIVFKIWKRPAFKRLKDIDITSGRREMDLTQILAEERAEQAQWPKWKKAWNWIC